MKKREHEDYFRDIFDAIIDIGAFTEGIAFKDFVKDKKTIYSVVRAIEIIGEATKNIPEYIRSKYPDVPWKRMAGMRDKLIHEYFGVDLEIVWETIEQDLPPLKEIIQKVMEDIND
jgi:uncharacterized protein with HEPN domain